MSHESIVLGAEINGLLQEIAADRNSSLLRVGKPAITRGFFDRQPAVSSFSSSLTKVERHVLQVHRAELALRLRELCLLKLTTAQTLGPWMDETMSSDQRARIAERRAWRARSDATLASLPSVRELDEGQSLLERCLGDGGDSGVSVSRAALASMRLEARENARVYVGLDMLFRGRPRSGLHMFRTVLSGKPAPHIASSTWQNIGLALSLTGERGQALNALKRAIVVYGDRSELVLNWLHMAVLLGDKKEVVAASDRLDGLMSGDDPILTVFVNKLIAQRALGYWRPTTQALRVSRPSMDSMGPASRRLVDVHA